MSTADLTILAAAFCLLVAPLALAGLALMNAGFARSRSAAHTPLCASTRVRCVVVVEQEIQHLRPRTNTIGAVARIRNACAFATHKFFQVGRRRSLAAARGPQS